jgi:hypothetical protein
MTMRRCLPAFALLLASGCAQRTGPQSPALEGEAASPLAGSPAVSTVQPAPDPARKLYLCANGQALVVHDEGDTVRISGLPRGEELLGRDAGGLTPQQAVFSGPTLRVEFGLGADGREMALQSLSPPELLSCRRS